MTNETWPALPLAGWQDTYATLHRCAQIVGKIQLALTPRLNHWWNVAFSVGPRGFLTQPIPVPAADGASSGGVFEIEFDFLDHNLVVRTNRKETRALALVSRSVADFERELMTILGALGIEVEFDDRPVEIPEDRTPFLEDRAHAAYDPEPVERFFRIVQASAVVLEEFRSRFIGKASPIQFYWGTFDLAASRFSGRRAPPRPGADAITREAYSHEVYSCGFWPGDARFPQPAYYAYVAPAPPTFARATVRPRPARFHAAMGEFLLPYDEVRRSARPRELLLDFFQSTYEAAADLAGWDRPSLEALPGLGAAPPPAHPPTAH